MVTARGYRTQKSIIKVLEAAGVGARKAAEQSPAKAVKASKLPLESKALIFKVLF